jgi:hypothetical protein
LHIGRDDFDALSFPGGSLGWVTNEATHFFACLEQSPRGGSADISGDSNYGVHIIFLSGLLVLVIQHAANPTLGRRIRHRRQGRTALLLTVATIFISIPTSSVRQWKNCG